MAEQNRQGEGFRYQAVEDRVRGMIENGTLAKGDRLPSLRNLSMSMGVSVSTVSQAYMELERKGLVQARERSGFFVSSTPRVLPAPVTRPTASPTPKAVTRSRLIGTVLETAGDRSLLPLGVICPSRELLPGKALSRIMAQVVRQDPLTPLAYEAIPGNAELRRQIAYRLQESGTDVAPDDIIITIGAMEALYISLRVLTRPGDTVCIQSPAYYCFLQLLETLGLRAIEVPSSPITGVDPAGLRQVLDTFDIRACVFCPNYNNPDGGLIPDQAKREIVDMLAERGIPLVEDDVSGDLNFGPVRPAACKKFDSHGQVILCSSFSKTLAPGYRVGWMAPGRYMEKALEIKATTNVCSVTPTQMAIAEFLRQGLFERHLKRLRQAMAKQTDALLLNLGRHFPEGTACTRPEGGGVLWIQLPRGVDSVRYFFAARERGIGISPGSIFSTLDKFNNYVRFSCGGVWTPAMEQGMITLGGLAADMAQGHVPEARQDSNLG